MWLAASELYRQVHGTLPPLDGDGMPAGPPSPEELRAVTAAQFTEDTQRVLVGSGMHLEDSYAHVAKTVEQTRLNMARPIAQAVPAHAYWGDELALAAVGSYLKVTPLMCDFDRPASSSGRYSIVTLLPGCVGTDSFVILKRPWGGPAAATTSTCWASTTTLDPPKRSSARRIFPTM